MVVCVMNTPFQLPSHIQAVSAQQGEESTSPGARVIALDCRPTALGDSPQTLSLTHRPPNTAIQG
jgi:hypothetical protein